MKAVARATVVVACLSLTSASCAKRSHGLIVAGVGVAGLIATGLVIRDCNSDEKGCGGVVLIVPIPVAVTIGGVLGAVTARGPRPAVTLPDPQPVQPSAPTPGVGSGSGVDETPGFDSAAVSLTQSARTAAIGGDCDEVKRLQPRVEAADASYYRAVFLADLAIVRCLNATPGATPDAAPPPAADAAPVMTPYAR